MRLLIVEDDEELQGQLQRQLKKNGYQVSVAGNGAEALFYLDEYEINLAIVDLGLPHMDGLTLIKKLRGQHCKVPVLILTARSGWKSKVEGLNVGADDYLTKPFQFEELSAHINALLRRAGSYTKVKLKAGPITLDKDSNIVCVDDKEVSLTAFEYNLLEYFMLNPQKVVSKIALGDRLYDGHEDTDSNVIEVIIARLRKKLDPDGSLNPIETMRGRGYRFMKLT